MRGSIEVSVQNERVKYDFVIKRNLTIIKGDSATGKTTLIDMIRDYNLLGDDSGVVLRCDKKCIVLEGIAWKNQLMNVNQSLVFIDEGNHFISTRDFAETIKTTDNYYILVTREAISTLPYSVNEIYGIRSKGKYGGLKQTYQEIFHLYSQAGEFTNIRPKKIITEDSNSGYQFFENVCREKGIECLSASGKSNISKEVLKCTDELTLVIADGAAFGPEMDRIHELLKRRPNVFIYLPESFEWLVLISDCVKDKEIHSMSSDWGANIESKSYFSWEQFFTDLLIRKTKDTYLKYNKKSMNKAYFEKNIQNKILNQMENIELR